ncbi:hypothetical protein [Sphingobacterium daejeonense]|uniref:hypothetical protein n=1 Tax=Sphingobacterium daejeonense TaxID=371142 RepID=UPI003D30FC9B
MRAISTRKHKALIPALQQLAESGVEPDQQDVQMKEIRDVTQALEQAYGKYEQLIAMLAESITEYEKMHHRFKVEIVGPALRTRSRKAKSESVKPPFQKNLKMALVK